MRIEELEVSNFCQHQYRHLQMRPGLTGVVGPVGSGKSNLIGAIQYVFTGDSPNAGKLQDNIRQTSIAGESSFARVKFNHRGVIGDLKRQLRPAGQATLRLADGETIRGDKKIKDWLDNLLALPKGVLENIVFAPQAEIFGFLAELPSKRLELFHKLFRTAKAKVVWSAIGGYLATNNSAGNMVAEDLQQANQQLEELSHRVVTCVAELQSSRRQEEITAEQQEIVRQHERVRSRDQWIAAHAQAVAALSQSASQNVAIAAAEAQREFDHASTIANAAVEAAKGSDALLHQCRQYAAAANRITQLTQQFDAHLTQRNALVWPVKPADYQLQDVYAAELATMRADLQRDELFVRTFSEQGFAECPTCGTATASILERVNTVRAELEPRRAAVLARSQLQERDRLFDQQAGLVQFEVNRLDTLLNSTRTALDEAIRTQPAVPTVTESELLQRVTAAQQASANVRNAMSALTLARDIESQHAREHARLEGTRQSAETQLQATQDVAGLTADTLRDRLGSLTTESAIRDNRESALNTATARLEEAQRRQAALQQRAAKSANMIEWGAKLHRVRDVLHDTASPLRVVQRTLMNLTGGINASLEKFQAEYRIAVTDDAAFIARFPDGRQQPADRLSCGQKVLLSVSWRIALNCLFADSLGLLVLDEPTAYLDETCIRGFDPALAALREMSVATGLQVILITHERSLTSLFDTVIDLAAG